MSLLGETRKISGTVNVQGKVAYVPQSAWIFSATIRQNILFGQPFDSFRYQTALKASAFKKDLDSMPDGDRTLVGDRGVTLSGGQKARLNLARAIYFQADVYLFDDPLSAVDVVVGKYLFEK